MYDEKKTVCFTGHRQIINAEIAVLPKEIDKCISLGYDTFLSGGALGFDQCAASAVLRLKKKHPFIKLVFVLPCDKNIMSKNWTLSQQIAFLFLLRGADDIIYTSYEYYDGCMKRRNEKLVEMSSLCIAYLRRERSGTGQTVRLMKKKGGAVINVIKNKM